MSKSDWDLDDLLNFDYDNPVPERRKASRSERYENRDYDEDIRLYEQLRQQSADEIIQQARQEAQDEVYEKYTKRKPNKKTKKNKPEKSKSNKLAAANKGTKLYKFAKVLSLFYIIALAAFVVVMTTMNILPFLMLVLLYVVLGLLSFIIVLQLTKNNIKRWAKVVSTTLAIILIFVYGLGCVYALGTLSFLDKTSVKNEAKVESITKEPFNVVMTGMDVNGTIDEQGRSDVNMVVTVNPKTETILMTSIPRDYEVQIPTFDYATDKLTHTGFYGKPGDISPTISAEETLLNTNMNYYVKVNFTTVKKFIDAVGGIDVYSEEEFTPVKLKSWRVQKGMNHMSGKQALAFARERKSFMTGDNQRVKNQQAVFEAMIKKMTSSKTMVLSYNKVITELDDYFEMSFSSREIRKLIRYQLARNPKWKIYKNALVGGNGSMGTYTTGSVKCYVMTQDPTSIANASSLIQAVLDGKKLKKNDDGLVTIVEEPEEGETQE